MPRSILLPILALAGVVLFGTTRAGRPAVAPEPRVVVDDTPRRVEVELPEARPMTPPPPAPTLRSRVEPEAIRPDSADAGAVPGDSASTEFGESAEL